MVVINIILKIVREQKLMMNHLFIFLGGLERGKMAVIILRTRGREKVL